MKKKDIFRCVAFCLPFLFLVAPEICSGSSMGDFDVDVTIATTSRHENYPDVAYNPIENEFIVMWRTDGPFEEGGESMDSLDGRLVSPEGELVGDPISLIAPFPGSAISPTPVHNVFRNEYMVTFSWGEEYTGRDTWIARIDSVGNIVPGGEPTLVFETPTNSNHQTLIFNSRDREFLLLFNDYNIYADDSDSDNVGFILDEDGGVVKDMFVIGSPARVQFNPRAAYNSTDNNYVVAWEDYRHYGTWTDPTDIYGSLLGADGDELVEIPIIDDFQEPNESDQRVQRAAYNPDRNEFLVIWADLTHPQYDAQAVAGRILQGEDGTPTGPPFLVVDGAGGQSSPQLVYLEDRKEYFTVWSDSRSDKTDVYGQYLSPSGQPIGNEIPICTREGNQTNPIVVYNPVMQRLLIAWRETNVDEPVEPPEPGAPGHMRPSAGDVMGRIIGMPSFCSTRVIERGTGNPVEDAQVVIIGRGLLEMERTNVGGWCNLTEDSQRNGTYFIIAWKGGHGMAMRSVRYEGEPLQPTIELR